MADAASRFDAIVIGAGPNGLVAARVLARRGRRVLVLEAADAIGGHTRAIEFAPGFRSPLTEDAGWVPPEVSALLKLDKLQKAGGAVSTTVIGPDRQTLHLPARTAQAVDRIRAVSERDAARWPAFIERMAKFAGILAELYRLAPTDIEADGMREVLPLLGVGRKLRGLGRRDMIEFLRVMPMSVQDLLDDIFENELLKGAIAAAAVRDLRQGPRSGGTTFNLLHYMVGAAAGSFRGRPWYLSAPDALATTIAAALQKRKVEIRTGARVARILVADDAVKGVLLSSGDELQAPLVLSTADPRTTLLGMVDTEWLDPEVTLALGNIRMRGCTALVFFGVDRVVDDPTKSFTTAVSLTPDTRALERAADAAKYGAIADEPHIEIFSPTLRWPQLAPEFKHVVTARVHYAPYALRDGAWDTGRRDALATRVTAAITRAVPNFEQTVQHRVVFAPTDIEAEFGMAEGALTQGEMALDQMLFMRPVPGLGQYRTPIAGLYLAGAGCHPGPGLPGAAGLLAARAVRQ